jgi:DNA-binding FrmR family transcriptional regulator
VRTGSPSCAPRAATKSPEAIMEQRPTVIAGSALDALQKKDVLNRLARVEGQLRGVQRLIALADVPADLETAAQQMAAARKALDRAFVQLLAGAMVTQTGNAASLEQAQAQAGHLAALLEKYA